MLAELAAFNAGFSVVRQVIANGRDLVDAYSSIEKMVGAKETLRARQKKKEKNVFSVLNSKKANDFEEFLALEKIHEAEKELTTFMKIYGRAGLYDDWISFQAEARKRRLAEKKEVEAIIAKRWEYGYWAFGVVMLVLGLWLIVQYFIYLKSTV
tara:strand:+ start:152 stop:613 length:462 start_codon:yes stop_codon:yes gene_type:complete